jgi:predicted metalloprotease with PDZ domain
MSRNIHKNKYKKNYDLIYNKGAVVAMMMDIEMMRRSDMQLNLLSFMKQLSKQYGYEKPFSELHLRDQFVNQCGLYMDDFFKKYIEGKRNVDLVTGFNQLGFQYHDSKHYTYCTFGDFYLDMENNEESLNVADAYANYLGLMVGDVIIEINEKKVKQLGMSEAATLLVNPIPKNYLMLTVLRNNSKVRLEGVPRMRTDVLKYVIEPMPRSDYQVKLHDYFIK